MEITTAELNATLYYTSGYKHQTRKDFEIQTTLRPLTPIVSEFIFLGTGGLLKIKAGYAWDGPSGPTIKTKSFVRGALVHDALYQLIREGRLYEEDRLEADKELRRICLEDGMWKIRAWWVYEIVRRAGWLAASPSYLKKVHVAP